MLELKLAGTVHCMDCAKKLVTLMHESAPDSIKSELLETYNGLILFGKHKDEDMNVIAFMATETESGNDIPVYTISPAITELVQVGMKLQKAVEAEAMDEAGELINKIKQSVH